MTQQFDYKNNEGYNVTTPQKQHFSCLSHTSGIHVSNPILILIAAMIQNVSQRAMIHLRKCKKVKSQKLRAY